MKTAQDEQLEYVLSNATIGVAILGAESLQIRYLNRYLHELLEERWCKTDVCGLLPQQVIPDRFQNLILPALQDMSQGGKRRQHFVELPFEGFLELRGLTYWNVTIERHPPIPQNSNNESTLVITIEDQTETVRSRLHLNAIHALSSAIAGPASLHLVLNRILQVLQEMFGSKRCAVMLLEQAIASPEALLAGYQEITSPYTATDGQIQKVRIAAQTGLHPQSYDWRPQVNEQILLRQVINEQRTLIVPDTALIPHIEMPFIDNKGHPQRPGSVLSVPIFEPRSPNQHMQELADARPDLNHTHIILGTIEVYHRRARGFPAGEIERLEQFAQQAGLAIKNARLLRDTDHWARAASRQARQKENVMQAIPDGIVICDPRWRVADANYAARQLMGWTTSIIGLPLGEALTQSTALFYEDHYPPHTTEMEQRALNGHSDEFKMRGADGLHYSIRCTYTPIRDDMGDLFAFIIIYHDISEQVEARERIEAEVINRTAELKQRNQTLQLIQEELTISNTRMALLLERMPAGIILVDTNDTRIELINRRAVQILQSAGVPLYPEDNLEEACRQTSGRICEELIRPIPWYNTQNVLVPYEEQPLAQALHQGRSVEAELHIQKGNEQDTHFLIKANPVRASDHTIASAILVYQEITRMKALEHAREDFFTTMAHELKTPLANIRAHLSALLAKDLQWSTDEQYEFLLTADEQVERLVGMINSFLDASRVDAGALRLALEPILIPELLEDLQERLEALITNSNRMLRIVTPEQLPAVEGDYELIMSVLTNLLSNAFRYTPEEDSVILSAAVAYDDEEQPDGVTFRVEDHGPGISEEQQETLFTRFSMLVALNRPSVDRPGQPEISRNRKNARWSPTTGLGLYISRGIIEAHRSHLTVNSHPGQGATFAFTLPLYQRKKE